MIINLHMPILKIQMAGTAEVRYDPRTARFFVLLAPEQEYTWPHRFHHLIPVLVRCQNQKLWKDIAQAIYWAYKRGRA